MPSFWRRSRCATTRSAKFDFSSTKTATTSHSITFDITLFDEEGVERVVIDSFSQKRVNDATGTIKLPAGTGARKDNAIEATTENGAQAEGAEAIYQRSLSEGISPEEGVEAFRRILAHEQELEKLAMLLEETDESVE